MPGPVVQSQGIPWWADPKGASVLDKPGQGMLRQIVGLLGLDDPTQIMAVGVPVEAGANTGGMLDVLAQKFPRLATAIKAYHGSPHDFERFDTSKIGTGEGAQAYGHGLYFAENPATAKAYRDQVSSQVKRQDPFHIDQIRGLVKSGTPVEEARAHVLNGLTDQLEEAKFNLRAAFTEAPRQTKHTINRIEVGKSERDLVDTLNRQITEVKAWPTDSLVNPERGKMYEVAIHAHPDQFLDWDKPLSQQSEYVQKAVRAARNKVMGDVRPVKLRDGSYGVTRINPDGTGNVIPGITERTPEAALAALEKEADYGSGQWVVDSLSRTIRKPGAFPELSIPDRKAAAETLREFGIPGIKYLDQGSRAAGEGSRNYVVFDDRLVDILKKYGIVATVAGAGAANQPERKQ